MPSRFACTSPEVEVLAREMGVMERGGREPLELLTTLKLQALPVFFLCEAQHGGRFGGGRCDSVPAAAFVRILRTL